MTRMAFSGEYQPVIQCNDGAMLSLGMQAALDYLEAPRTQVRFADNEIAYVSGRTGARSSIPLDDHGQLMVQYNDAMDRIKEISAIDVMSAFKNDKDSTFRPGYLKDKLVFFGNTSSRTGRFCATPLHPNYPTILLHASVANNLLQGIHPSSAGNKIDLFLLICIGLTCVFPALFLRSAALMLFNLLLAPLMAFSGFFLFRYYHVSFSLFALESYFMVLFSMLVIYRYLHYKNILIISMQELQEALKLKVQALQELQETLNLKERLAAIGEISAMVAHEIITPLSHIKNSANLLRRNVGEQEKVDKYAGYIDEAIQRADNFSKKLLRFTRIESPILQSFDLAQEVNHVRQALMPEAMEKKAVIQNIVEPPFLLKADPDMMRILLMNLVKNSLDAVEVGGRIEIHALKEEHLAVIRVADNGAGIAAELLDKVFIPFFTRKGKGTGLGLAMVKKIVDAHGGKIGIISTPGIITEVTIRLPLQEKE